MKTEDKKGVHEIEIFRRFIMRSGIKIDDSSVEKRPVGEPDILCDYLEEGPVAFELAELCDPNIARILNDPPDEIEMIWTSDPSVRIFRKKRTRPYETDYPIELLLYWNGRIVTPDDVIIPTIRASAECGLGPYRRVWYLGEHRTELIHGNT